MSSTPPTPPLNRNSSSGTTASSNTTISSSTEPGPPEPTPPPPLKRSHHAPSRRGQPVAVKPLAPKRAPMIAKQWQPLTVVNRDSVRRAVEKKAETVCAVCSRPTCNLTSHRTLATKLRKEDPGNTIAHIEFSNPQNVPYLHSYAYRYVARAYVDTGLSQGRIDPFHNLPLSGLLDTPRNHALFHYYFAHESQQAVAAPKPAHMATDMVLSPFFSIAMQDAAVCLSILALAAAMWPTNRGLPPDHVGALELGSQAMARVRENAGGVGALDTVCIAQVFLWALSTVILDKADMESHASSVRNLVSARGGLKNLGLQGIIAAFVRWIDARHSLLTHTASWYVDAPDPPALEPPPAKKYGSFWDTKAATDILSEDVLDACRNICRTAEVMDDGIENGISTRAYMWLMGKNLYLCKSRSRVLERHDNTNTLDECVALANELAIQYIIDNVHKQRKAWFLQAQPLIRAMQEIDRRSPRLFSDQCDQIELFLWMLISVVMIPYEFEGKEVGVQFLCCLIRNTMVEDGRLPADWIDQLFHKMEQFTWSNVKLRQLFEKACQAIQDTILSES